MSITRLQVHVPDEELAELDRRLDSTRFIDPQPEADWRAGLPVEYLRELVEHWRTRFDWRRVEDRINGFVNLRVDVDGLGIHCVPRRGTGPQPIPIVLVHGWPSSFVELLDLADHLADPVGHGADGADAFDVVVPSLPGFG
jgi:hypothetical protein